MEQTRGGLAMAAVVAIVVAACTGTGESAAPSLPTTVGAGEGELSVLARPGYVEDGATDPGIDWVSPFETETGCDVTVQTFRTSDEAFALFETNPEQYDVLSASGDASLRLVAGGFVAPVNVDLIPSYAEIFPDLKDKDFNTVDGVPYGVPHGRGANILMWRTDEVSEPPTSWSAMFDPDSPYAGRFSVYDAPIYIADAAVVLMSTDPELGIRNPYSLDGMQFQAAIDLLKAQKPAVGEYWRDNIRQIDSFRNGDSVLGTTRQVIANALQGSDPPVPVEVVKPAEGATGRSDTWMINSKTRSINCAYKFLEHMTSASTNIQIAEYVGEAPGNSMSCELASNPDHCTIYHAAETQYWNDVWYWTTPVADCLDGRTDVLCEDYAAWVDAWTEIRNE